MNNLSRLLKFFILYREKEGERKSIELYSIFYLSEGGEGSTYFLIPILVFFIVFLEKNYFYFKEGYLRLRMMIYYPM